MRHIDKVMSGYCMQSILLLLLLLLFFFDLLVFETEGRHANVKAQEAVTGGALYRIFVYHVRRRGICLGAI